MNECDKRPIKKLRDKLECASVWSAKNRTAFSDGCNIYLTDKEIMFLLKLLKGILE